MNKTFCTMPWINISVDPDGSIKTCCISSNYIRKEDGTKFNLGYDKLEDIYNSKNFIDIREKMLLGEPVAGCQRCYDQENRSEISSRMSYSHFDIENSSPKISNIKIKYFDLRFGNLCNLKCRSCNSTASNQIQKEINEISNPDIKKFYHTIDKDMNSWYKTDIFKENLENQLKNIEYIYLAGGEPTLIEENKFFLKRLIECGKNNDIRIKMSTNMTNLNKELFELLSKFKKIRILASVDGFNSIQEYLRYPSNWSQIDKNIKNILSHENFILCFAPVIQVGNLNKITDLFDYIENLKNHAKCVVDIHPILLQTPDYLNIKNLPLEYKIKCWEKINDWHISKYTDTTKDTYFEKALKGVKFKCFENIDYIDNLKTFKYVTSIIDKHRKHYLQDVNPELFEIIKDI